MSEREECGSIVLIAGVAFELADASAFAVRARRYSTGKSLPGLSPGEALATQLEQLVSQGGGPAKLSDAEKEAAAAIVAEWRGKSGAPASAGALYYALASGAG
jgi:hypothetical protein